jgi:hypothetical protein
MVETWTVGMAVAVPDILGVFGVGRGLVVVSELTVVQRQGIWGWWDFWLWGCGRTVEFLVRGCG